MTGTCRSSSVRDNPIRNEHLGQNTKKDVCKNMVDMCMADLRVKLKFH